jgi:hypothetical protein
MDAGLRREMSWTTGALAAKNGVFEAKTAVFRPKNGQNRGLDVTFSLTVINCIYLNLCKLYDSGEPKKPQNP